MENIFKYCIAIGTAFSGLGCPEYVLRLLGINFTSEFVIENDKYCQQTLKKNHNPKKIFGDITKVKGKILKSLAKIDLYVFGFPCQNFSQSSTATGREGLQGETGVLFWDGLRVLASTQPKFAIAENVKGLVNHDGGKTFKTIMKAFEDLGIYNVYYKVINPLDIGGITNRERIYFVLVRKDIGFKFDFPAEVKSTKNLSDYLLDGTYKYYNEKKFVKWNTPIEKQRGKLKKDFRYLKTFREADSRVFNINHGCPTIQRKAPILINDGQGIRDLAIKEMKGIQGFGDSLDLSHLSDAQCQSQLGNTMEVTTIKAILKQIIKIDIEYIKQQTQEQSPLVA